MGGAAAPAPMGGASDVPQGPDPMGGGMPSDPGMGGDPSMGPADMPPADGNGQLDPNMGDMGGDPMGGDPSMDEPMDGGEGDDSTVSIINQLNDKDKETVRAYAESLLSTEEENDGEDMGDEDAPMGGDPSMEDPNAQGGAPMMETVIFTKKQLKTINENFLQMSDDDEKQERKAGAKKGNKLNKKSPFNSPKFK